MPGGGRDADGSDTRARQERRRQHPYRPYRRALQYRGGTRLAFAEAGIDPELIDATPALLGLAGSNVGTYRQQLEAILPFPQCAVESDALIALEGALGSGDGAIAILGTGSAYMLRRGGVARTVGGWGFLVGDQGSGARIGRDLLEETLLGYDNIRPASPLTAALLAVFRDNPRDVVEFTTTAKPGDFGGFAPMVFEHAAKGDEVAEFILTRAVADIEASLGVLDLRDDEPLCLLGGLAALYAPRLSEPLSRAHAPADPGCAWRRGGDGGTAVRGAERPPMADLADRDIRRNEGRRCQTACRSISS